MSKKSRKQRERKRAKVVDKAKDSDQLLKLQKNNQARTDSLQYLEHWQASKNHVPPSPKSKTEDQSTTDEHAGPKWKF